MRPWVEPVVHPPGWRMAGHAHDDMAELVLVDAGGLRVMLDGRPVEVRPGQAVVFPAGVRHQESATGPRSLRTRYLGWRPSQPVPAGVHADGEGRIGQVLDWLLAADLDGVDAALWPPLLAALEHALRRPAEDPAAQRLRRAVRDDLARPWRVGDLARIAGLPRSTFHRWFRAAFAAAPAAWVRRERLAAAGRLLRHEHAAVADAARRVGLRDGRELARLARRLTGRPPTALRRGG